MTPPRGRTEPEKPQQKGLRVTAVLVTVKDSNGAVRYLAQGDLVPDGTPQESIDHLRSLGYVADDE